MDAACIRIESVPVDGELDETDTPELAIPCHFTLTANVGGEAHSFAFEEAFSGG